MRASKYLFYTLKDKKINNSSLVQDFMIKSGLIRKISSGIYAWMPTGFKILNKINDLIRNEMKKINAIELLIPILQPINIWESNNKLNLCKSELFFCETKNNKKFILSPTNEIIISNLFKKEIHSNKELPLILFQIQNKFRNELRCKGGLIRTKEFIMKDSYSFHENEKCLKKTYQKICITYKNIFKKLNLKFFINKADSGFIGNNLSHEFNTISKYGENKIAICSKTNNSGNIEIINNINNLKNNYFLNIKNKIELVNIKNENDRNFYFKNKIKIFIFYANKNYTSSKLIALVIKNEHKLSKFKINKLIQLHKPIQFANEKEIYLITKTSLDFIGIINLNIPIIIDYDVSLMNNFITGANINEKFFLYVNWYRDIKMPIIEDIREIENNDISPFNKKGILKLNNSIEIAHIFKLDNKYSKNINFNINDKYGYKTNVLMGCYGIGISRMIFSIIEQNIYKNSIIWPDKISPFEIVIIPINMFNKNKIRKISEKIYNVLIKNNIDVLFYDKNEYLGNIFYNIELIGIPNLIIISEKNKGKIEYIERINKKKTLIDEKDLLNIITKN